MLERAIRLVVVLVALVMLWPAPARSQTSQAAQRFNEGLDLARKKQYSAAITIWLTVIDKLDPAVQPSLHKALGLAYRKTKKLPEAWHHLQRARTLATRPDPQVARWQAAVTRKLAKRYRPLQVSCGETAATIRFGAGESTPTYACPVAWWLKPGKRSVWMAVQGGKFKRTEVRVPAAARKQPLQVSLAPPKPPPAQIRVEQPRPQVVQLAKPKLMPVVVAQPDPEPGSAWGWVTVGTGVALVAAAGTLHGLSFARNETLHEQYLDPAAAPPGLSPKAAYDQAYDDEVFATITTAYVLYGAGAVALIAGTILVALDAPAEDKPARHTWRLHPVGPAGTRGATLDVRF